MKRLFAIYAVPHCVIKIQNCLNFPALCIQQTKALLLIIDFLLHDRFMISSGMTISEGSYILLNSAIIANCLSANKAKVTFPRHYPNVCLQGLTKYFNHNIRFPDTAWLTTEFQYSVSWIYFHLNTEHFSKPILHALAFWRRIFFLNCSTPCI